MKPLFSRGFTLTELLIVVSIMGLIFFLIFVNWKRQIDRGYDAQRKTDLTKIRRAFEEYYNDHNCYPPVTILDNCGSADLAPYLPAVPCDPVTNLPYRYVPVDESNLCRGYRLLATLADTGDPVIASLGCNGITGCGFGAGYNYGVASGVTVAAPGFDPSATPTPTSAVVPTATPTPTPTLAPTPTPTPFLGGRFACTPGGDCNAYADPAGAGCPITFVNPTCDNACGDRANRCLQ